MTFRRCLVLYLFHSTETRRWTSWDSNEANCTRRRDTQIKSELEHNATWHTSLAFQRTLDKRINNQDSKSDFPKEKFYTHIAYYIVRCVTDCTKYSFSMAKITRTFVNNVIKLINTT